MVLKVDMGKLVFLMKENGICTYAQLAKESGASENSIKKLSPGGYVSKECLWLISDRLGVPINDFVYPDWSQKSADSAL